MQRNLIIGAGMILAIVFMFAAVASSQDFANVEAVAPAIVVAPAGTFGAIPTHIQQMWTPGDAACTAPANTATVGIPVHCALERAADYTRLGYQWSVAPLDGGKQPSTSGGRDYTFSFTPREAGDHQITARVWVTSELMDPIERTLMIRVVHAENWFNRNKVWLLSVGGVVGSVYTWRCLSVPARRGCF